MNCTELLVPWFGLVVSLVFWLSIGHVVQWTCRFSWQKDRIDRAMARAKELSSDDMKRAQEGAHEHYREAMADYDKSLVWAAGGALAASYAIYDVLIDGTPNDVQYLAWGWIILVLAVFVRIGSPYAATRNFAQSEEFWRLHDKKLYKKLNEKKAREARTLSFRYGRLTKYFNEFAMFALFNSIYLIGLFVWRNLPTT